MSSYGNQLIPRLERLIHQLKSDGLRGGKGMLSPEQQHSLHEIERRVERATAPSQTLEHALMPLVPFFASSLSNLSKKLQDRLPGMTNDDGLLFSYLLDGQGGGSHADWEAVRDWHPAHGALWVHLECKNPTVRQWIALESGVGEITADALLSEETRPRTTLTPSGLLLTLRGMNSHPEADPEDMVAVQLWSDGKRIITVRRRRLLSAAEIAKAIENGTGPKTASEFVEAMTDRVTERMGGVIDELNEHVDYLEDAVLTQESHELRPKISELRRNTIGLRRYLAPQREAVSRLILEKISWLSDMDRSRLRESADRTTRLVEELDLIRERAIVVQEELTSRLSEKMDRTMYVLSIVASIFLPLGFLTGLLGINVGGIPGAEYSGAFAVFCGLLVSVVAFQIWLFKHKKWM